MPAMSIARAQSHNLNRLVAIREYEQRENAKRKNKRSKSNPLKRVNVTQEMKEVFEPRNDPAEEIRDKGWIHLCRECWYRLC